MQVTRNERGFQVLQHPPYIDKPDSDSRIASMSSKIGPYDDSFQRPGTSYLWLGQDHHLNREEVAELVKHLQAWLETGSLETTAIA